MKKVRDMTAAEYQAAKRTIINPRQVVTEKQATEKPATDMTDIEAAAQFPATVSAMELTEAEYRIERNKLTERK